MPDSYDKLLPGLDSPAYDIFSITPSDGADLAQTTRGLWVGTGGNVSVITKGGTTVTITNVADGSILPFRVARVRSTGTTASNILGLV